MRPRFTATSVPPLSSGPRSHGSEAAHAVTVADSAGDRCREMQPFRVGPATGLSPRIWWAPGAHQIEQCLAGARGPVPSSRLISAQNIEHHVVNDLVGRCGLDHGPDSPGQGHLADRLTELCAGPGQPAIQDLIVGRGQVDRDPDGFGAGLLGAGLLGPGLFRWARPPGRWTVRHEPSLLHVRHLPRAGPLAVPERGCLSTASTSFAVSFGVPRVFPRCRHLGKEMGDSDR
jgi:hypothetical protein